MTKQELDRMHELEAREISLEEFKKLSWEESHAYLNEVHHPLFELRRKKYKAQRMAMVIAMCE